MVTPKSGGLEGPDVTPPSWDTTAQDLTRHLAEGGDLDADTLERLADAAQEARKADHGSPVTLYRWRDIPKPPPQSWVVTDWIPAGCLSVIVGAGAATASPPSPSSWPQPWQAEPAVPMIGC